MASIFEQVQTEDTEAGTGVRATANFTLGFVFGNAPSNIPTQVTVVFFSGADEIRNVTDDRLTDRTWEIYLNGLSIYSRTATNATYWSDRATITANASNINILGIKCTARAQGNFGIGVNYDTTATCERYYWVRSIPSGTTGLILMDIQATPTYIARWIYILPDLNTLSNGSILMLKNKTRVRQKIYIISVGNFQQIEYDPAYNNPTALFQLFIDDQDQFRSACYTLFADRTGSFPNNNIWRILNFYPQRYGASEGYNQIRSGSTYVVTNANKRATAIANRINIFNVNANTDRTSQDNEIALPAASSGALCVIVYAGNNGSKASNNSLTFTHTQTIEGPNGPYNNSTNKCWIYSDSNQKNTGILFVSDGTFWYVVGWYFTEGMAWDNTDNRWFQPLQITNIQMTEPSQITQVRIPRNGIDFLLPASIPTITDTSTGGLILFKISHDLGGNLVFHTNPPNQGAQAFFNESMQRVYFAFNGGGYSCAWFAYERRANGVLYYYPVIWHTPQYRGGQPGFWSPPS